MEHNDDDYLDSLRREWPRLAVADDSSRLQAIIVAKKMEQGRNKGHFRHHVAALREMSTQMFGLDCTTPGIPTWSPTAVLTGPNMLNFAEQMGSGAVVMLAWSFLTSDAICLNAPNIMLQQLRATS
jgi:hypothetical protein